MAENGMAATVDRVATSVPGTAAAATGTGRPRSTGSQRGQTSPQPVKGRW
jgi:hypothetical protein